MSYKVLVLLKPGDTQIAMERASQFARFVPEIEVVACRIINDLPDGKEQELAAEGYKHEIDNLMKNYPSITKYIPKVVFSKDVPEAFCDVAEADAEHYDLAIISANRRNTLKDMFFSPLDSRIMRHICIPLLIVKDAQAPQRLGKAIMVASDLEDANHDSNIDDALVVAAKIFAENFNGEVHLLNCVPPTHRGLMSGNTEIPKILDHGKPVTRANTHISVLLKLAERHGINKDFCHVVEGRVDEMIPKTVNKFDARMVCMGTSSKDGMLRALDQSAGELVLEQIKGDILTVNKHVHLPRKGA